MLSALSEASADFLLVGAYALAVHGHPRSTGDLDIWVRANKENATSLGGERDQGQEGCVEFEAAL